MIVQFCTIKFFCITSVPEYVYILLPLGKGLCVTDKRSSK